MIGAAGWWLPGQAESCQRRDELLRFRAATDDYPMAPGNEASRWSVVLARRRTQFGPMPAFGEGPASHGDGKAGQHQLLSGADENLAALTSLASRAKAAARDARRLFLVGQSCLALTIHLSGSGGYQQGCCGRHEDHDGGENAVGGEHGHGSKGHDREAADA